MPNASTPGGPLAMFVKRIAAKTSRMITEITTAIHAPILADEFSIALDLQLPGRVCSDKNGSKCRGGQVVHHMPDSRMNMYIKDEAGSDGRDAGHQTL